MGSPKWKDGLAVFTYAARKAVALSTRPVDLLAIVPETLSRWEMQSLADVGLEVRSFPVPVPSREMTSFMRYSVENHGCCGDLEQLKYYGAAMTEYMWVLMLDADVLILGPIHELFDLSPDHALVGTYNHNLDVAHSIFPPVQGGFLMFAPDMEDFKALERLTREGDYRQGSGWKGSNTGMVWGGSGPQGLLSFYYNQVRRGETEDFNRTSPLKGYDVPGNFTVQPSHSRFLPLDHSVYNVLMPDRPRMQKYFPYKAWMAKRFWHNSSRIKVFHFSGKCQKPWYCYRVGSEICTEITDRWWEMRHEMLEERGVVGTPRCLPGQHYQPLSIWDSDTVGH